MSHNHEPPLRPLLPELDAAIQAHRQFKVGLRDAVDGRAGGELDVERIGDDQACSLGQWLRLQRADLSLQAIKDEHHRFHAQAARIVGMAKEGQRKAAQRALEGEYEFLSAQLEDLLTRFGRA